MDSFEFDICEKDISGAEHIVDVNREVIAAFVRHCKINGITKAKLAKRLGVDRSVVTKMLRGNSNLTLRTVGELCWAIDVKPVFKAVDFSDRPNGGDVLTQERSYASSVAFRKSVVHNTSSAPISRIDYHPVISEALA